MFLREFRPELQGLPDLLNYAALIAEGVVLLKDGGFTAGWSFRGEDLESATEHELGAMASRINGCLTRLGSGWMMHVDAARREQTGYPKAGAFPDRTTRTIEEARREHYMMEGSHYVTTYALLLTWWPPTDPETRAAALFVEGEGQARSATRHLEQFQSHCRQLEDALSGALRMQRMRDLPWDGGRRSELLQYLRFALTGHDQPIRIPSVPMYLDAVIGRKELLGGYRPRIGEERIVPVALDGYPVESYPGILDFLNRLPLHYRWSNRFIFLDPIDAQKELERYRAKWWQKRKSVRALVAEWFGGKSAQINIDADQMAKDALEAVAEASSGLVRYGYYTSVINLMDPIEARVRETAYAVLKVLANHGFTGRIETLNALEAWLGTLPGHAYPNVRRPPLHTLNLAHLLPTTSVWPGHDRHPCPYYPPESPPLLYAGTTGATPFRLTLHEGDVGHTLVLGPTGSGKSTLLGMIAASHFRYPKAQVFFFDKKYSAYVLCTASGGHHYAIAAEESPLTFYPLARVHEATERAWAAEWIEALVQLQGLSITPQHRETLHRALGLLGASESRTLTDLMNTLQDYDLRAALNHYTLSGAMGSLLDADRDGLREDIFQVFELDHFLALGDKNTIPVLLYLFHRIEQRLDGRPTIVIVDEAVFALKHPLFREKLEEWLRTTRKANAALVFASQSVSDVMSSPIRDVILESCPTKILLPNPEATAHHVRPHYEALGLNARQIALIAQATPKRDYYLICPGGRRLFSLDLGAVELAFVGASGKDDIRLAQSFEAQHGQRWPAEWLASRGLASAAELWLSL